MFGTDSSFLAGYIEGESSSEYRKAISDLALTAAGLGTVEIRQHDLNELHARVQQAEATATNNYLSANDWMAFAKNLEQENTNLKSRLHEMNSVTRERDALLKFLDLAGHLLHTHKVGRSDRPEFAGLRDFALDIALRHLKGELYEGLGDDPAMVAWFSKLWDALN